MLLKLLRFIKNYKNSKFYFFLIGIASTVWFLFRVIPKPSRATYPCMRVASPLMSGMVIYLISLFGSIAAFRTFKKNFARSHYRFAFAFLILFVICGAIFIVNDSKFSFATKHSIKGISFPVASNIPVGEALGLYPGRVVWAHNTDMTNEKYNPVAGSKNFWYSNTNVNQTQVDLTLSYAIMQYANTENIDTAWNYIFSYFNSAHGFGKVGYKKGEKIVVKINLTNQVSTSEERMNATPHLVLALLKQLIEHVGVNPKDIILGDPYRQFRQEYKDICASIYPTVNYVDGTGSLGVTKTVPSSLEVLKFSNGKAKSTLPQYYLDAKYFINMPCLKTHADGGITIAAKNHQGSYLPLGGKPESQSAKMLHDYLFINSPGTGKYRHLVDYMGHKETGGKTLIYLVDGIWGGDGWEGFIHKFQTEPFNTDYPNSILISQDPVAIESVCFDVLFQENLVDTSMREYPVTLRAEIADYLKQCASSAYWPSGISYDPEGDGTPIASQGVFEHWNNASDRKYTRNLGTGDGIELLYVNSFTPVGLNKNDVDFTFIAYPNPFNICTTIKFNNGPDDVVFRVFNLNGKLVKIVRVNNFNQIQWYGDDQNGNKLRSGVYICSLENSKTKKTYTKKLTLLD